MKWRVQDISHVGRFDDWLSRTVRRSLVLLIVPPILIMGIQLIDKGMAGLVVGLVLAALLYLGTVLETCNRLTRWWAPLLEGVLAGAIFGGAVALTCYFDVSFKGKDIDGLMLFAFWLAASALIHFSIWRLEHALFGRIVLLDGRKRCFNCSYDLEYTESTVCPECGWGIETGLPRIESR